METVLRKAIEILGSGLVGTEAGVKQAVIVPILRGLGWDDSNPKEFVPEYTVRHASTGRVDYALLEPGGGARVFIEAKKLGRVDEAGEGQLFRYAAHEGVPLLVLTDGDVWDFYLSMAAGRPAERRFYRAVLTSGKVTEYAKSFERFLGKARVCSGDARIVAEQQHTSNQAKDKANKAIPKAWRALLEGPAPELRDMLANAVENACGTTPEQDDLDKFLGGQLCPGTQRESGTRTRYAPPVETPPTPESRPTPETRPIPESQTTLESQQKSTIGEKIIAQRIVEYVLDGRHYKTRHSTHTFSEILQEFHRRDRAFMSRFAARTQGKSRRLVAQSREGINDNKKMIRFAVDLNNGWWLGTCYSSSTVRDNIELACEVANVAFGSQLRLINRGD